MAKEFTPPRKPDYELCCVLKGTKIQRAIGAGWLNQDGSIHIKFDYFADLNQARDVDVCVTLFDRRGERG